MTVVSPNSISGINSITVATGEALSIHGADGALVSTLTNTSGIATYKGIHVGSGTTTANQGVIVGTGASIVSDAVNKLSVYTNNTKNVEIDATKTLLKSPSGANTTVRLQHTGNSGYGDIILDRTVNAFIIDNDPTNAGSNATYLSVKTAGTEKLRTTSAGDVGISTAAPASKLHLYDAASDGLIVQSPSGLHYVWAIQTNDNLNNGSLAGELGIRAQSGFSISANNGTTTQFRLDSSGRVKIGASAAVTQTRDLNIGSNSEANLAIETHNDATSESSNIRFFKSGNTGASPQVVETDDNIARLQAYGYDGTDYNCQACGIDFAVDGAPGSNDMPGKIIFKTTADAAASPTERMRIDKDGYVTHPSKRGAAFCARQNTGNSSLSASDIIVYNGMSDNWSSFDPGDNYNTSTGKYTAPVAGVYYFEAQAMTTGWSNGNTTQDLLALTSNNGVISYPRDRRSTFDSSIDANGYFTNSVSGMTLLAAGDTVWVIVNQACGVSNTQYSYFQGYLVG